MAAGRPRKSADGRVVRTVILSEDVVRSVCHLALNEGASYSDMYDALLREALMAREQAEKKRAKRRKG